MSSESDERKERRDLAGSTSILTYHRLAGIELALESGGGQFNQPTTVVGSEPAVHYPRLPANSPHAFDPVPPGEFLGISVDYVEPCGTAVEIAASIEIQTLGVDASTPTSSAIRLRRMWPERMGRAERTWPWWAMARMGFPCFPIRSSRTHPLQPIPSKSNAERASNDQEQMARHGTSPPYDRR